MEELLEVAKQNKHRFTDADGKYLPFVKEMFDYVGKKHKEIKGAKASANASSGEGKAKTGGSGGGDDGGDGGDKTAKIFGHNYKEFKGKEKAAIEKLLETKDGYVEAAYHKEGIGDIDVVYGAVTDDEKHKGFGLAHILDKHPDITPETIDTVIKNGTVEARKKGFNIRLGNYIVGVNKGYQRRGKVYTTDNYIVTSYEKMEADGKSKLVTRQGFSEQNGRIRLPNPSDKPNVSQTDSAVKQKTQKNAGKRDTAKTPDELAQQFGLRGVEISDKVDAETAQWHVKKCAEGLADIADITGIPDKLISLNGRLSLAIGMRDKRNALASYSPYLRSINISKTRGAGSLAHEWFHAFDNLLLDAMGINKGWYRYFATDKYKDLSDREAAALKKYLEAPEGSEEKSKAREKCEKLEVGIPEAPTEEHQIRVMAAFEELKKAMMEGDVPVAVWLKYSLDDIAAAKKKIREDAGGIGEAIYRAEDIDEAAKIILERSKSESEREKWLKLAAAHYFGEERKDLRIKVSTGRRTAAFLRDAESLDGKSGSYWQTPSEMAARAFEAYIKDKLAEQGRSNDYLTHIKYDSDRLLYPQGEERKRINAAFDKLFRVIAETGAIRKAISATAKKKRWLWIEGGKVWVRKSVMDAWKRAMAEQDEA